MSAAFTVWRADGLRARRAVVVVIVALAVLSGISLARRWPGRGRIASTFGAYQRADVRLSDLAGPTRSPPISIESRQSPDSAGGAQQARRTSGSMAIRSCTGGSWTTSGTPASSGPSTGRFFTQDRVSFLEGRLPKQGSTREIVSLSKAREQVRHRDRRPWSIWEFRSESQPAERSAYSGLWVVAALPPVIVDENDIIEGAVLPPAAT